MGATSLDLSQIKTDVLTYASTFRSLIGLGNVDNTSDLNKPISSATQAALDLKANSSALASYVAKAGDTMTGRLTTPSVLLSGNFSAPAWTTNGVGISHAARTLTDTSSSGTVAAAYTNVLGGNTIAASAATTYTDYASLFLGSPTAGANVTITNPFSLITAGAARFGGNISAVGGTFSGTVSGNNLTASNRITAYDVFSNSFRCMMFNHFNVANGFGYTFSPNSTAANGSEEFGWYRDATRSVALSGGANATRLNLYGTYTDASNYRRLYISSTTAGAFTLGVEGLGTGLSGNTLNIANNLGIGTSSANVGLVIRRSGTDLPAMRLEDGDVTVPFTGINFSPNINANTVGAWQPVASASGGCAFTGFTNNTAAAYPVLFEAYHGSASPTAPAVCFSGFKTNGSTGATTLASNELLAGFYNGSVAGSPVVAISASGATTFSGKITAPATGQANTGGIGNGGNGIDFFQGVIIYNTSSVAAPYPAYFCDGQSTSKLKLHPNTELQWDSGDPTATRNNGDLRVARDAPNVLAQRNGANAQTWRLYNTFTDASNFIRQALSFTTYSGTVYAQHVAEGLGTGAVNIPFVITPRGTGAFILGPMPDGTATGGNARGANSIDIQLTRDSATQVASGTNTIAIGISNTAAQYDSVAIGKLNNTSFGGIGIGWANTATMTGVGIGQNNSATGDQATGVGSSNTASGQFSFAAGRQSQATASRAFALGTQALSNRFGMLAFANGQFSTVGDVQKTQFIARNRTTDATPITLMLDGSSTRLTVTTGEILGFIVNIVGSKSDGSAIAHYVRKGCIKRVGSTTSLVGSIETIGTDYEDNPLTDVSITADDTNDALQIQVTGITGETWRWAATIEAVDLGFGT